jgi:hypothetical protein
MRVGLIDPALLFAVVAGPFLFGLEREQRRQCGI